MITSYIKSSFRNILRHKLFTSISIIGFAASMSIGLLLISILTDVASYDSLHKKKKNIYRITSRSTDQNNNTTDLATTSIKTLKLIRENIPGVEATTIVRYGFGGDFGFEEKSVPVHGLWADQSFLNIFSFTWVKGDAKTALQEPYSIVLTEGSAKKIFGEADPLGKSISLKNESGANEIYTITGILKDIPKFSHLQFEALGSFSTVDIIGKNNADIWQWDNIWSNFVYVVLKNADAVSKLQNNLNTLSDAENLKIADDKIKISLFIQPIRKIILGKNLENEFSRRIPLQFIIIMSVLSFLVLLSAFFNYSNLSIARSLQRSHEVAIRKVSGARRIHILIQFIAEAALISSISLVLALFVFINIRAFFFTQFPDLSPVLNLNLSPVLILYFILFSTLTGILAGVVPGIYFSKISTIAAIKNVLPTNRLPRITIRKALIIIQFVFSLIFITSTLIFLSQYKDFVRFDLGFNTNNVLNIKIQGNKPELLEKELSGMPEIVNLSKSFMITSVGNNYYLYTKYDKLQDSVKVWYNKIDEKYIPLFEFNIEYGRNFIPGNSNSETGEVIVNENLIRRLNIENGNIQNAIGKYIIGEKKKFQIVGVVADFHFSTVDREIGPFMFRYTNTGFKFINAKISTLNVAGLLGKVQNIWKNIDEVHPLNAAFYNDQIRNYYNNYYSLVRLIGFLSILEILIASIGLLGMVVFSIEIRLKEIGVRKVFGASFKSLFSILSRGFLSLILISALIALPIVYIIFEKLILNQIRYHSPVRALDMIFATLVITLISILVIGSQIYRMVRTKPSELLKNE